MKRRRPKVVSLRGTGFHGPSEYDFVFNLPLDEGWFTAKQYGISSLGDVFEEEILIQNLGRMKLWELLDRTPPHSQKAASMRLMRHKRNGFLRKRQKGRAYHYRLTDKGWFQALSNYESKHRPHRQAFRLERTP